MRLRLKRTKRSGKPSVAHKLYSYQFIHRLLAEGNFILSACEGSLNGVHSSFYDLYRVDHNKLAEH